MDRTEGTLIESDAYEKRMILSLPLLLPGPRNTQKCTGVLQITNRCDEMPFDAQDEAAATLVAAMAARGLNNARAYEAKEIEAARLQRHNELQASLLRCSLVVAPPSESSSMQEVVRELASECGKLVPSSGVRVELLVGCQMWLITHASVSGADVAGVPEEAWQTPQACVTHRRPNPVLPRHAP